MTQSSELRLGVENSQLDITDKLQILVCVSAENCACPHPALQTDQLKILKLGDNA